MLSNLGGSHPFILDSTNSLRSRSKMPNAAPSSRAQCPDPEAHTHTNKHTHTHTRTDTHTHTRTHARTLTHTETYSLARADTPSLTHTRPGVLPQDVWRCRIKACWHSTPSSPWRPSLPQKALADSAGLQLPTKRAKDTGSLTDDSSAFFVDYMSTTLLMTSDGLLTSSGPL